MRIPVIVLSLVICLICAPVNALAAEIDVYLSDSCGFCRQLETFFQQKGIEYRRHDIDTSSSAQKQYQEYGGGGVPLIIIDSSTIIRGFNPRKILEALGERGPAASRNLI